MDKPSNPKDLLGVRKAPMSTVSAAVLAEVGVAMLEGACKYGRSNYRAVGVRSSVYYDAAMRHLMDWWEGVDIDPDSGLHHVAKAISALVVLRDAMIQGMLTDDRPPRSAEFYARLNKLAGEIIDRHADKSPIHYTQAMLDAGMREHAAREEDADAARPFRKWSGGTMLPSGVYTHTLVEVKMAKDGDGAPLLVIAKGRAIQFNWSGEGTYPVVEWRCL